jgi:hypothetical protein
MAVVFAAAVLFSADADAQGRWAAEWLKMATTAAAANWEAPRCSHQWYLCIPLPSLACAALLPRSTKVRSRVGGWYYNRREINERGQTALIDSDLWLWRARQNFRDQRKRYGQLRIQARK